MDVALTAAAAQSNPTNSLASSLVRLGWIMHCDCRSPQARPPSSPLARASSRNLFFLLSPIPSMGCAQSVSKRLGSMSLFDVEVYDPSTRQEVSFTDLCADEQQQQQQQSHADAGSSSPRAEAGGGRALAMPRPQLSATSRVDDERDRSRTTSGAHASSSAVSGDAPVDLAAQMRELRSAEAKEGRV